MPAKQFQNKSEFKSKDPPVIIRDIVIAAQTPELLNPAGEFQNPLSDETQEKTHERLYEQIRDLCLIASSIHKKNNYKHHNLKKNKKNHITRLITNEFYFYTLKPLTLLEFQELQNKIAALAEKLPENLHFILGSFAVRVDSVVISVVPHIECGEAPKMQFLVKNYPSSIDPGYLIYEGRFKRLFRFNVQKDELPRPLLVDGVGNVAFTIDNVIKSSSAGDVVFYSCIDLCMDHQEGVAKRNFFEHISKDFLSCGEDITRNYNHVVISNSIDLVPENSLGLITHADPIFSHFLSEDNAIHSIPLTDIKFGTAACIIELPPFFCSQLSYNEFSKVFEPMQQQRLKTNLIEKLNIYLHIHMGEANKETISSYNIKRLFNFKTHTSEKDKLDAVNHLLALLKQENDDPLETQEIKILRKGSLKKLIEPFRDLRELSSILDSEWSKNTP